MTREDAIDKVRGYLTDIIPAEDYLEVEEIIKALKQEPILDKVKAEIEQTAFKDVNGEGFIFVNRVNQIIDKYKAESEV